MRLDGTASAASDSELDATPESVGESLRSVGVWKTYDRLQALEDSRPADLTIYGLTEIVRNVIVRDFLSEGKGLDSTPKLTAEFLTDYGRFDLSAKEGYLVSLIDGRLTLQRLVSVSPLDAFTTVFYLAKLRYQKVIHLT